MPSEVTKLSAADGKAEDLFGWGVGVFPDGGTIVEGAIDDDDKHYMYGAVFQFPSW